MLRGFLRSLSSKLGTGNTRSSWVVTFKPGFAIALAGLWILAGLPAAAFPVAPSGPNVTLTTLAVTSGGSAVTSVASGSKVTLTASVTANGSAVTVGLVNFCDASATYCTDIHLLGSAQLTGLGTAAISLYPGIGSHSYKAVYVGTPGAATTVYLSSVSSPNASLTVTGLYPTATAITNVTGSAPPYSLTATVTGYVNSTSVVAPAGTVSFLDTSNSNYLLGTPALGASTAGLGFLNSQTAAVGNYPESIAMGDFNGDGIPDLAVANYSLPGTVTILLGQGDGTFKEATAANLGGSCLGSCSPLSAGAGPVSVAVGDFNGDGISDLVVADISGNGVMVFLGNGDGTFTYKSSPQTDIYPVSVAVGDFNGDGIPDLAVTSQCGATGDCSQSSGVVTILLGNGDGTFTPTTGGPITVGLNPAFVTTGDFNGDGNIDLAISNLDSQTVTILLGNGDGTFKEATAANLGTCEGMCSPLSVTQSIYGTDYQLQFSSIAIGDFNGDGIPDLAMANQSGYLVIFLGQGDGTFAQATGSPIAIQGGQSMPTAVAVGDFNGDGRADLAVTDGQSWNMISILLGNGDGTFVQTATPAASNSDALVVGDFNRDGVPDLAATTFPGSSVTVLVTQMTQTAIATASSISPTGAGTHNVVANYSAGATYASSGSTTTPLTGVAPASITVITGSNQSAFVTTAFTTSLEVQVLDQSNNPMPGVTVNFAVPPSGASATLSSYAVTTDSYGEAMVTATANATTGSYTVSAGISTLSTGFALTNTPPPPIMVTTLTDDASGIITNCTNPSLSATSCSLRDAIAAAAAVSTSTLTPTINFASSLNLTTAAPGDYNVTTGGTLNIGANMNIQGPGAKLLSIDGGGAVGVFNISSGTVSISGLTITNGNVSGGNGKGGGIYNSGTLNVANSAFIANVVYIDGGAIFNANGVLTVDTSTFSGNSSGCGGGGIFNDIGTTTVTNSTFASNSAGCGEGGGGIVNSDGGTLNVATSVFTANTGTTGGGISTISGTVTVTNSTFSGNNGTNWGGGIYDVSTALTVTNSTFSGNTTPWFGGGILNDGGILTVISSTLSGNGASSGGSGIFNEGGGKLYLVNVLSPDSIPNIDSVTGSVLSGNVNLAPLGNYGGPTQTMPPYPNSNAICAGSSGPWTLASGSFNLTTTDQRGNPRPTMNYGPACVDAGAVQTAYSVNFVVPPSNPQYVNQVFSPALTVQLTDNGQAIALPGASIGMSLSAGSLWGTTSQSTDATGLATFGDLSVPTAEKGVYLSAFITGNWGTTVSESGNFDVDLVPQTINITQALPTTAIYNGVNLTSSTSATGGASGNPVIFSIDPVSTPGIANIVGSTLTISGLGAIVVDANQAAGGSYAAAPQVQQTIVVVPDAPATIVVYSGNSQSAVVGSAFTNNLTAQVIDGSGVGVYGVTVTFAVPTSGPSATLSTYTVVTDLNGMASVTATANATAGGPYQVTASYPTSGFATFSLTNLPPPAFTVTTLVDDNPNSNGTGNASLCNDTSTGNTPNSGCSLRDAIAAAAAAPQSTITPVTAALMPTINFAATQSTSSGSITLTTSTPGDYNVTTGGTLNIGNNMNISGPGANLLSIDGGNAVGVFNIASGTVSISGLTITNGSNGNGGGVYSNGTLTVSNSTFSGNTANGSYPNNQGGAIYNDASGVLTVTNTSFTGNSAAWQGAAILNSNMLTVTNSIFSGNSALAGAGILVNPGVSATVTGSTFSGNSSTSGSGIFSTGNVTVTNSTFSGNSAQGGDGAGAAIYQWGGSGTLTVTNSTFSGNNSQNAGGAILNNSSTVILANTIVAGNTAASRADDVDGGYSDQGGNIVGNSAAAVSLAPLGNYGGTTQTMMPYPNSVAICAGLPANAIAAQLATDQRGDKRWTKLYTDGGAGCVDAGAVQTAYSLSFIASPSTPQQSGTAFNPSPAVQLNDHKQPITLAGAPITVALNSGAFSGGSPTIYTDLNGVSTFTGLTVSTSTALPSDYIIASAPAGPYTITANSTIFDIDPLPQTILFTLPGTAMYNGVNLTDTLSATGGSSGNPVTFTIDGNSTPGIASIVGNTLTISGPGTVIVDANQAAGGNYAAAAQAQQTMYVTLDTPATIAVYSGNSQSAVVGSAFTNNLTAQVVDGNNIGVWGVSVTFNVPNSGQGATLSTYTAVTDLNGMASVTATANATAGPYQVTASYLGSGFATFSLTNLTPPVYTVTTLTDDAPGAAGNCNDISQGATPNSGCSLRDAIAAAAAIPQSTITPVTAALMPTVTFASSLNLSTSTPGNYNVTTGGTLNIGANMNIAGPGANVLSINGAGLVGVFNISGGTVSISELNITSGNAPYGGAINNQGLLTVTKDLFNGNTATGTTTPRGGAIYNTGTLNVSGSWFLANATTGTVRGEGGAIFNYGTANVWASTFSGNLATGGAKNAGGGALCNGGGSLSINNSTFFGNFASGANGTRGGAIVNHGYGTLVVNDSTLTGNWANQYGGGIYLENGTMTLANTIVSGNALATSTTSINGYDDLDDQTGNATFAGGSSDAGGNVVGNYNAAFLSALPTQPPTPAISLAPLGNYGGPTQTMVPLPGSPAICAGTTSPNGVTLPNRDQRGNPRSTTVYSSTPCVDAGAVQTAYLLGFITSPSNPQLAGTAFTPAPAVQLYDLNPATRHPALIALPSAPITVALSAGVFSGGLPTVYTDPNGVSTFTGLVVSTSTTLSNDQLTASAPAGPYTITANSTNFDIDLVPQTINITQALPTAPIYNGLNLNYSTSATGGSSGNPIIFAIDINSTPGIANITSGGALTISGPGTVIVDANQAGGGNYAAATQVQQTITVTLDTPVAIAATAGSTPQSARVGAAFTNPLQVKVTDGGGNGVWGATVTFAVPSSGPSATLSSSTAITDLNGLASVTATANATAGAYNVTVSVAGISTNSSFSLTNLPPPAFTVTTLTDDNPNGNGTGNAALCNDTSTSNAPSSGCSLRDAIAAAATTSTSTLTPTVNFASSLNLTTSAPGDYNVTTGGTLNIANNMNIVGPGANLLSIDGGGSVQVFNINSGTVSISGLTITKGNIGSGSIGGGGLLNNGKLTVTNSTFSSNFAAYYGGGIFNNGTLTVTGSTFSGNSVASGDAGYGGGINNWAGTLTVTNSTFSGNSAPYYGGGIYNSGPLTVTDSTFSGNSVTIYSGTVGAGIYNQAPGTVSLANSIVAGNAAAGGADNFDGAAYTDNGGNVTTGATLSPLGYYGGTTPTMMPIPGSSAICVISPSTATGTDQRGNPRTTAIYTDSGTCQDAGAVQTAYTLKFTTSPSSTQETNVALTPGPVVQLYDLNPATGQPAPIALSGAQIILGLGTGSFTTGPAIRNVYTGSTGAATYGGLIVSSPQSNAALYATSPVGPWAISAKSSNFNIVAMTLTPAAGSLSPATYGVAYSQQFIAGKGTTPYTYTATGLPLGLSINSGTGALTGTPTSTAGSPNTVVVTATDADSNSVSQSYTLAVGPAASSISVSPSVNPVFVQDTVTYTAAVGFATAPSLTTVPGPTGTVTFSDGGTPITACTGVMLGAYSSTSGAATATCAVSYASGTPATHSITATYTAGSANFTGSASGTLTEAVADFTIAAQSGTLQNASITVQPGAAGQYTFILSPQSPATTFPTAITLTVSGLPPGATYSFSPSATIAAGAGATTETLTIQTAQTTSQNSPNTGGRLASRLASISLALLLMPFVGRLRKAGKRFSRMLPILLLLVAGLAAVVGLNGCGGKSGPPPQSYTVGVTATSGTLSHSFNIDLTVE
jgi:CSLREA domain-containing protein